MVYSFDIFDTLITRSVARPGDIFSLMARELSRHPGSLGSLARGFRLRRRKAERIARVKSGREDILIEDIYEQMGFMTGLSREDLAFLSDMEIGMESRVLRPVRRVCAFYERLRARGERVLIISDMYLPERAVRRLLSSCGIVPPERGIYLSGEQGVLKRTGKMFRRVLAREKLTPGDLMHIGDNRWSDQWVPMLMGIRVTPV